MCAEKVTSILQPLKVAGPPDLSVVPRFRRKSLSCSECSELLLYTLRLLPFCFFLLVSDFRSSWTLNAFMKLQHAGSLLNRVTFHPADKYE